jgi:phage terminase large subunit-like protein
VRYDPYQLVAVAQRLLQQGLPMVEFPQSVPNLTESSTNLFELIKGRNLIVYPDDDLRIAVSRAVALETTRGWRIAKEKQSHKIDVVIALALAALGAVQGGQRPVEFAYTPVPPRPDSLAAVYRRSLDSLYADGQAIADQEDREAARQRQLNRQSSRQRSLW